MPELPEVEAVCRKLRKAATGARIATARIQRFRITGKQDPAEAESLAAGRLIGQVERRGKNILVHLSGGVAMRVHLRMTGNLLVIPDHRLRPSAVSAWFAFEDGRALIFEDPRGLGTLDIRPSADFEKLPLGPEPLSSAFSAEAFARSAAGVRQPAKLFLMDQRRVAGLGNIYAAEALFSAGIDPRRPIGAIRRARLDRLHAAITAILRDAVRSAFRAYSRPGGFEGADFTPAVYGREGERCDVCGAAIRRIAQGGRSTYFCPKCQR